MLHLGPKKKYVPSRALKECHLLLRNKTYSKEYLTMYPRESILWVQNQLLYIWVFIYMCVFYIYTCIHTCMHVIVCMCMCEREEERTEELQCLFSINQVIFQTRKNVVTKPRIPLNELMQSQKIMAVTAVWARPEFGLFCMCTSLYILLWNKLHLQFWVVHWRRRLLAVPSNKFLHLSLKQW